MVFRKIVLENRNWYRTSERAWSHSAEGYLLWHFRLWSFQGRDTKLERFLAKNQLYSNEITKF